MVISRAIVRDLFDHRESVKIFSLLMLVMGVAPILAPLLGGFIATQFDWHMIFWFVGIVAALCLAAIVTMLPESKEDDPAVHIRESFQTYAMVLKDKNFVRNVFTGGFAQAGMFAYITASPNVMINVFGVPPEKFGLVFGSNAAGLILMAQVNAYLMKWWGPQQVLKVSVLLLATLGGFVFGSSVLDLGFWGIVIPLFGYIAVMGITFPNATANSLAGQGAKAGAASALIGTMQFVLASTAAGLMSLFHAPSAVPMAAMVACCGVLSAATYLSKTHTAHGTSGTNPRTS